MCSAGSQPPAADWLVENGPRELELLFRAIVYHPSAPILITDDDGNSRDASAGVSKLLGLPREKIIGRQIDDFAPPGFKPQVSQLWRAFLEQGEQEGTLQLVGPDGTPREVEYTAKGNVLPVRHALVLRDKTAPAATAPTGSIPSWVQDYALYLLDVDGRIVAWYSGAERIYGYQADEAIGQHVSFLYPGDDTLQVKLAGRVQAGRGRRPYGNRRLAPEKTGRDSGPMSSPWRSETRTENCRALRESCATSAIVTRETRSCGAAARASGRSRLQSTIAGIVSGEFDRFPRRTMRFSNWSDTAAKICWRAG